VCVCVCVYVCEGIERDNKRQGEESERAKRKKE
jgi:hypothetical protein